MTEKSRQSSLALTGGLCGLCLGALAVPLVPSLSGAVKIGIVTMAPVVGFLGVAMGIGAAMGSAIGSSIKQQS